MARTRAEQSTKPGWRVLSGSCRDASDKVSQLPLSHGMGGFAHTRPNTCLIVILFDEHPEAGLGPSTLQPDSITVVLTSGIPWLPNMLPGLCISKPAPTSSRIAWPRS